MGNVWGEGFKFGGGPSMASASYISIMSEIHVLLIDHESESLLNAGKMLELCQYRVTLVELASAGITMLRNGNIKFDIILANINSPDLHGFKLLEQAVDMSIPIVAMSSDENILVAMRAVEMGATQFIPKPVKIDAIKALWQHVLKAKNRMVRERERIMMGPSIGAQGIQVPIPNEGDKGKGKKKIRGRKEDGFDSDHMNSGRVRRKVCTEWTQELHEKFMASVRQLGEGRCFPKEILDLMNVPGLTRMQVASHLQKCRNDNWRSPEERKSSCPSVPQESSDTEGGSSGAGAVAGGLPKARRFGSMPRLVVKSNSTDAGDGAAKSTQSETENGNPNPNPNETVNENDDTVNVGNDEIAPDNYEGLIMHHDGAGGSSSNVRPPPPPPPPPQHASTPADDFFNIPEMDCLMQNFQGSSSMMMIMGNPNTPATSAAVSSSGGFHSFEAYQQQGHMETRSHWNAEGSGEFGGDASDTAAEGRGH
ncbi:two-component response regulator ARR2-like [Andrographis paniculata]|uniref:two-component response regulator ARR2-like n=1 Tax=Andrographis paniculata TaxID=175694 RepID=UPI0021E74F4F|nr:two-component response regulator ARR2-like [Andrographis paniculata]